MFESALFAGLPNVEVLEMLQLFSTIIPKLTELGQKLGVNAQGSYTCLRLDKVLGVLQITTLTEADAMHE